MGLFGNFLTANDYQKNSSFYFEFWGLFVHKVPTGRLLPCQLQMLPCYVKEASYDQNMKILLNCSIFPLEKERGLSSFWTIVSLCSSKIELEIMLTPTNKSHGFFMCPTWLLKCSRHITSAPLATLINNSVQRGIFLSKLKHAKIILINGRTRDPGPVVLYHFFRSLIDCLRKLCTTI